MVFLWQYAERKMLIRCSEIWVFVIQISQTNGTELQTLKLITIKLLHVSTYRFSFLDPTAITHRQLDWTFSGITKRVSTCFFDTNSSKMRLFFLNEWEVNKATNRGHHRYCIHVYNVYHSNRRWRTDFCSQYISLLNRYIDLLTLVLWLWFELVKSCINIMYLF